MRGRGVVSVSVSVFGRVASVLSLALLLAWPGSIAGPRSRDHRAAISLAVEVDATAALVVGASLEGDR